MGWLLGLLVLALLLLHARNFHRLRGWNTRVTTTGRRAIDVTISFAIPTVILIVVFSQVKAFYGDRFNLVTNLVYFRHGLPDVFVLLVAGTLPDYIQGTTKLAMWKAASAPSSLIQTGREQL
jgi:hypothetical protein